MDLLELFFARVDVSKGQTYTPAETLRESLRDWEKWGEVHGKGLNSPWSGVDMIPPHPSCYPAVEAWLGGWIKGFNKRVRKL